MHFVSGTQALKQVGQLTFAASDFETCDEVDDANWIRQFSFPGYGTGLATICCNREQ